MPILEDPTFRLATRPANGVSLRCAEIGPEDGPLVILLHGFPEFWWGWRHQMPALAAAGYRVVAPDQRGYGGSDRPEGIAAYRLDRLSDDVAALAAALGHERFRLAGHDWGGLVAWWVAARHRAAVSHLAILNAPHPEVANAYALAHPGQIRRGLYIGLFLLPRLPEALLSADDFRRLAATLVRSSRPGTFPPRDLDTYREAWRRPGAMTAMLNWYRALPRRPALARPDIEAPTLILWGERDSFLEPGLASASLPLAPNGRVRFLADATHWLHLEEPDLVSRALLEAFA